MERQRTKLGARFLTIEEMELILPNAKAIYKQIDGFRNNIVFKENGELTDQKTNNIGIMGRRGAGKTSVLRTFHKKLNEDCQKRDIVLPIIIPENMSPGMTLMDTILGMLKTYVEARKDRGKKGGDCIYEGRNPLEKSYNSMLKQYCYIKKDYRDLLIRQFTTEQYYVDKTTEIFNSDTRFIQLFHAFLDELLGDGKDTESRAMLFVFIDDIDLSTKRSIDVVKTLLSYLSNQRIVTFISGDIETFEEALTLEFLRQENALAKGVFQNIYCANVSNDKVLLARKKELAYEYLKKIIPPAYRYEIKYWSLAERGKYKIAEAVDGKSMSFAELLCEVTKEKVDKNYFGFGEQKCPNVSYHLFDDTSRGLNNVYIVLQELYELQEEDGKEKDGDLSLWRLIEAIVDSKLQYTRNHNEIFEKIIVREQDSVVVNFKNLDTFLYNGEDLEENEKKNEKGDGKENSADPKNVNEIDFKFSPVEKFSLFLLADFTEHLFAGKGVETPEYRLIKNKIIEEYINHESIDGEIEAERERISFTTLSPKGNLQKILKEFLNQGDFIFNLYFVKNMGRESIRNMLNNEKEVKKDYYLFSYHLADTTFMMYSEKEEQEKLLASFYLSMADEILLLFSNIELDADVIFGEKLIEGFEYDITGYIKGGKKQRIVDEIIEGVDINVTYGKRQFVLDLHESLDSIKYSQRGLLFWIYYYKQAAERREINLVSRGGWESELKNLIGKGIVKTLMNHLKGVYDNYAVKGISEEIYGWLKQTDVKKEDIIISLIDEKNMWGSRYTEEKIFPYINKKRKEFLSKIVSGRVLFDASEFLGEGGDYIRFREYITKISKYTLCYKFAGKLDELILLSKQSNYLSLNHLFVLEYMLENFLYNHPRIRYGKKELRQLNKKLTELPVLLNKDKEEWEKAQRNVRKNEDDFFEKIVKEEKLKECLKKALKSGSQYQDILLAETISLEDILERLKEEYEGYVRTVALNSSLDDMGIKDFLTERFRLKENPLFTDCEIYYLIYLILEKEIKELEGEYLDNKNIMSDSAENDSLWSEKEKTLPINKLKFYMHGYLRYLQMNAEDSFIDGKMAEKIAKLAELLLNSEIEADRQVQNEVYDIVSERLQITEEEFEMLF